MPASPADRLPVEIAGETLLLLGGRALYWPARDRLVIADLHLGKGRVFRRAGIPVPRGVTGSDLERLSQLVALSGARELWIVGDMLHGPGEDAGWKTLWQEWRQQQQALEVGVLAGNHDRALASAGLQVSLLGEQCEDGPFVFRHLPGTDAQGRHVIAGHLHPVVRVPGLPRRWPAFWLRKNLTILPAYSDFTGGLAVQPDRGDRLVVCVEGMVVEVPAGARPFVR